MATEEIVTDSGPREVGQAKGLIPAWWLEAGVYGVLLVTAAILRLWDLGSRAMHHDESLHAYYAWTLTKTGEYVHDPLMHGPFQFEASAGIFFLFGDSEFTARLLYAVAGVLLVGMPFLFRARLGRVGAMMVAGLLTFSPALLYFSRFARNDILVAVWTLGLVISMWRYIDEGKNRYLYVSAALLALAFATKETAFITTAILGLFLTLLIAPTLQLKSRREGTDGELSPPVALWRLLTAIWSTLRRNMRLSNVSRPASFLILLITLTLPQWSAMVSIFQDTPLLSWSGLVLAAPEGGGVVGAPTGGGLWIGGLVVIAMLSASIYAGARWNWSVWSRCALIFYGIWVLLYTTFFTNINGIGSGMWRSLGYWVVQQGEGRGGQPWYYYFVITSIYEFLPLIFAVAAGVYYFRRNDIFGHFLAFWCIATFLLYTMASEKMPWLLVSITLPLIILSGKFLADLVVGIRWRAVLRSGGIFFAPGVPIFVILLYLLAFYQPEERGIVDVLLPLALAAILIAMAAIGTAIAKREQTRSAVAIAAVSFAALLLVLTVRTGIRASFENGETPVEMIVYTQTSPDVMEVVEEIKQAAEATGTGDRLPVIVDQTSGFTWPWAWYLRYDSIASYPSYQGDTPQVAPDTSVLLVHADNQQRIDPLLQDAYTPGRRYKHRWWFPEEIYRELTPWKFVSAFWDRDSWRSAMDYFLYREGVEDRLGSEDSFVYFKRDLPQGAPATE